MTILTTGRGFRYPDDAQDPNIPRDISALAFDLDGQYIARSDVASLPAFGKPGRRALIASTGAIYLDIGTAWLLESSPIPHVTALPSFPNDGQEIRLLADDTDGAMWSLRYRSGAPSTYKWESVGGGWITDEITANETTVSTSITDLTTVGPTVTVPYKGDYEVFYGATCLSAGSTNSIVIVALNAGGSISSNNRIEATVESLNGTIALYRTARVNVAANGAVIKVQYGGTGIGNQFARRILHVRALRLAP